MLRTSSWASKTIQFIVLACFILAATKNIVEAFAYGHSSWSMSDLLVNYQGGFVRRGLLGQICYLLGGFTGLPINVVAISISLLAFAFVVVYLCKTTKLLPVFVLFSPIFLGSAAFGQFIVRKDFVMISLFILLVNQLTKKPDVKQSVLWVNVIIVCGTLIHEAFYFLALGAILNIWKVGQSSIQKLLLTLRKYFTLFLLPLIPIVAPGSSTVAIDINNSLVPTWERIEGVGCCDNPSATIESLGWDAGKALELPFSVLNDYSHGIWVPMGWMVCFILPLLVLRGMMSRNNASRFRNLFFVQIICFIPIFVIGWDYGRWGFLVFVTTIVLFNVVSESAHLEGEATIPTKTYSSFLVLMTAMPICCWSVEIYVGSSPLGYVYFNILKPFLGV